MRFAKACIVVLLAAVLTAGLCPAFAMAGSAVGSSQNAPSQAAGTAAVQELAGMSAQGVGVQDVGASAGIGIAADVGAYGDGTYSLENFNTGLGMFKIDDGRKLEEPYAVIKGDKAWLVVTDGQHRYDQIAWGTRETIAAGGVEGYEGQAMYKADGSLGGYRFVMPLSKAALVGALDAPSTSLYFIVRYKKGYSADHDGDWYVAGNDYNFTFTGLAKTSDSTELPASQWTTVAFSVRDGYTGESVDGATLEVVDSQGVKCWPEQGAYKLAVGRDHTVSITAAGYKPVTETYRVTSAETAHAFEILPAYIDRETVASTVTSDAATFPVNGSTNVRRTRNNLDGSLVVDFQIATSPLLYDTVQYPTVIGADYLGTSTVFADDDGVFGIALRNTAAAQAFASGQPVTMLFHHAIAKCWVERRVTVDLDAHTVAIDGGELDIEAVRAMITALPYDPVSVVADDEPLIEATLLAYNALSAEGRQTLDTTVYKSSNNYGRALETAVWALRSLAAVDNSTTLPDGTYTGKASSTCSLGKSDSLRKQIFTLKKVIVKDGKATGLIEHDGDAPNVVYVGRQAYNRVNADAKSRSQFVIPISLNSTMYLMQMAKNPTASTVGIAYEFSTQMNESTAVPDPEESGSGGDGGSESESGSGGTSKTGDKGGDKTGDKTSDKTSDRSPAAKTSAKAPSVNRANSVVPFASAGVRQATTAKQAGAAQPKQAVGNNAASSANAAADQATGGAGDASVEPAVSWLASVLASPVFLACAMLALALSGALGFTMRFLQREYRKLG